MSKTQTGKRNPAALFALILAGETIFFLPFVLARVFRPTLLAVFQISNFELGTYFSVYGIVAVVSYFFGGPLADRYPARNLISAALVATGLGGLVLATTPSTSWLGWLYGFWGFTTIFLFWAALIRATREWGGGDYQGRAYGFLEGGRGLTAAIIATLAVLVFSENAGDAEAAAFASHRTESFQWVVLTVVGITFLSALLAWLLIPKTLNNLDEDVQKHTAKAVLYLLRKPAIWLNAIIIVSAYVGYKITDDYSLYANQVLGFNEVQSAGVGTTAIWLRAVFAVLAGFLADRFRATQVVSWSFIIMMAGGALLFFDVFQAAVIPSLIILAATLAGIYGLRGIYFAIMQEANIPVGATGAAVGIISVVGYLPDIFMSPFMGYLLDTFPGALGHRYVLGLLLLFGAIGLVAAALFRKVTKKA
jgi:sugar phosphate permease